MSGAKLVAWALVAFVAILFGIRAVVLYAFGDLQTALLLAGAGLVIAAAILLTIGRDAKR